MTGSRTGSAASICFTTSTLPLVAENRKLGCSSALFLYTLHTKIYHHQVMSAETGHCPTCQCYSSRSSQLEYDQTFPLVHTDDGIRFLKEKPRVFSLRRNTLTSTHRLPSEVLVKIFSLAINQADFLFKMLTNIASVCSYWRSLIVNDSLSWSDISVKHPSAIQCMLQRSKPVPISISITLTTSLSKAFLTEVMSHLHRMTSLELVTEDDDCLAGITEVLQREQAPLLCSLSLFNYSGVTQDPLPCIAPGIKFLDLSDWILPVQPATYAHNLRRLVIRRINYMLAEIQLSQLLDVLSMTIALEELDLEYPFYTYDNPLIFSEPRIVSLTELSRLRLHESIPLATAFLEHTTVAHYTSLDLKIDLHASSEGTVEERVRIFALAILSWMKPREGHGKHHTVILSGDDDEDSLVFYFSRGLDFEWPTPEVTRIQVAHAQGDIDSLIDTILGMRVIVSQLGLHELGVDDSADTMLISLNHYAPIERLVLLGSKFEDCLHALLDLDFIERKSVLNGVHTIVLRMVSLSPSLRLAPAVLTDVFCGTDVREIVIERSEGMTTEVLEKLRKNIEVVTWDGQNSIGG